MASLSELLRRRTDALRSLVKRSTFKPESDLTDVFDIVVPERYPELSNDPEYAWLTGYIRGMADALNVTARELLYDQLTEKDLKP